MKIEPKYNLQLRKEGSGTEVMDPVRKKFVKLTPEEFVRQHLIRYLHEDLGYPYSRMQVEKALIFAQRSGRIDLAVFDRDGKALILVECKQSEHPINQQVVDQAARYNLKYRVPWLVVSNGKESHCYQIDYNRMLTIERYALPPADNL